MCTSAKNIGIFRSIKCQYVCKCNPTETPHPTHVHDYRFGLHHGGNNNKTKSFKSWHLSCAEYNMHGLWGSCWILPLNICFHNHLLFSWSSHAGHLLLPLLLLLSVIVIVVVVGGFVLLVTVLDTTTVFTATVLSCSQWFLHSCCCCCWNNRRFVSKVCKYCANKSQKLQNIGKQQEKQNPWSKNQQAKPNKEKHTHSTSTVQVTW